ncbi:sulfurtransferase [Pelomonas sp. SE-A7]|uniref:sulfurtransferase n=1 Tax=Pelomonas sp. SE-A7 TaxID=3054953 RepID=UPI00259C8394|nr:sulfurtransferase [Pelomonas sp. SE-A7]MDM4765560.1 sulfurtransferase [Pelomonas sp. SE-A7]
MQEGPVLNISSYKFVELPDTAQLREQLFERAQALGLKGTVLLAEEGINLFLAGTAEAVRGWVAQLKGDPRFADLDPKESWSEAVPFKKLLVKVKGEIIRMNMPQIRPDRAPRPAAVTPETLSRWLDQGHDDQGRPIAMLDTRNAFEVDYGTFDNAIDWRIHKFTEFPAALAEHKNELMGKTVVSFCTGGIRCEKAAMVLEQQGLDGPIYQLEGGILRYFEYAQGKHYHGSCFVFDQREALDAGLHTPADLQRPASEAHRG